MIRVLLSLLLLFSAFSSHAQEGKAIGPNPPCSSFGTTAGTCPQGGTIAAAGPVGTATAAPTITFNAAGQLTTVTTTTITPAVGSITGLATNVPAWLATSSSANLAAAVTDETGSGSLVFGTSPILTTVDARGVWTAGATWTLPAHTLGGTISGGGNQINNVIIGTTTPLAGAFTTLSTTSDISAGSNITLSSTGAFATGRLYRDATNGVVLAGFAGSGSDISLASAAGSVIVTIPTGTTSTKFSNAILAPGLASTSAAQTGTLCWVTGTGNITVDTTTTCLLSAGKYKHDIKPLVGDSLAKVVALRPVSYEYNPELAIAGEQVGFLAEDVAAIDDRLVSHDPADGSVRAVRYQQLTAVLAGAIKELKSDNDNLRACQASWKCRIFGVH